MYKPITIQLKQEEYETVKKLMAAGKTQIAIFRKGLQWYIENSVEELTQNNVS